MGTALLFVSCHKQDCGACFSPPQPLKIALIAAQTGDNLLNAAPYHPDSVQLFYVKDSRQVKVPFKVMPYAGLGPVIHSSDLSWLSLSDAHTFYLYLNQNDTDTLYVKTVAKSSDCCTSHPLESFLVNGEQVPQDRGTDVYTVEK